MARPRFPRVQLRGGPPGHPHVYAKRVMHIDRQAEDGDVVEVVTRERRPVGYGFVHRSSLVTLRMLTRDVREVPDEVWLAQRIAAAHRLRVDVLRLPDVTDAWRLLHAEGDGLSGLVVDRYGPVAVVSLYSAGWFHRQDELAEALCDNAEVHEVVFRVDTRTQTHEGFELPEPKQREPITITEHGLRFLVDPTGGHKTGFFLDQRDNRRFVASVARGRRVFDGMTYTGGFAISAAAAGAARVRAMDLDEDAIAAGKRNAKLNAEAIGTTELEFEHGDVFDALRGMLAKPVEERPEVLVLDPAKWAKARGGLGAALARYRDLNRLGFEAVAPGGLVITHTCSGLVSEEMFLEVLSDAAREAGREVAVVRVAGASPDHPFALRAPEGRYLNSIALSVE